MCRASAAGGVVGAWRLTGRPEKARKSLLAVRGLWQFMKLELVRFWKA